MAFERRQSGQVSGCRGPGRAGRGLGKTASARFRSRTRNELAAQKASQRASYSRRRVSFWVPIFCLFTPMQFSPSRATIRLQDPMKREPRYQQVAQPPPSRAEAPSIPQTERRVARRPAEHSRALGRQSSSSPSRQSTKKSVHLPIPPMFGHSERDVAQAPKKRRCL